MNRWRRSLMMQITGRHWKEAIQATAKQIQITLTVSMVIPFLISCNRLYKIHYLLFYQITFIFKLLYFSKVIFHKHLNTSAWGVADIEPVLFYDLCSVFALFLFYAVKRVLGVTSIIPNLQKTTIREIALTKKKRLYWISLLVSLNNNAFLKCT